MADKIGKIKKVDLRDIFENEAQDFTPWLEKNVAYLSEAIGITITELQRESAIGDFSADLVGLEENSEDRIIIENQLEQTDHNHLGKLLTYASGTNAKYLIWVAKKIRPEHQSALSWLNRNLVNVSCFGVEVNAISIDDSKPALNFDVVVEPNSWDREVVSSIADVGERHQKYLQFFTRLVAEYEKKRPSWGHLTARPSSWLAFGAGRSGFRFAWAFKGNSQFSTELYIDTGDKEEIKAYFAELKEKSREIDAKIPGLVWEELPEKRASRLSVLYQMSVPARQLKDDEMDVVIQWAIEKMSLFKTDLTPYVQALADRD